MPLSCIVETQENVLSLTQFNYPKSTKETPHPLLTPFVLISVVYTTLFLIKEEIKMDKNLHVVSSATEEEEENDNLTIADIFENDVLFNALMAQVHALKNTIEAYVESLEIVPAYAELLASGLDDLIMYVLQDIQDYVDDINAEIAESPTTLTTVNREEDNDNA